MKIINKSKSHLNNFGFYYLVIVIIILGIFYLFTLNKDLGGLGGDNAQYILLAKSLSEGKGYRSINLPGEPIHNQYPPVFPLMLLPIVASVGINFFYMHLEIILISLFSLIVLYFINYDLFKNPIPPLIIIIMFGLHPSFVSYQIQILTEIPYILFSLSAIYFMLKYFKNSKSSNKFFFPACAFLLLSALTRTVGVSLYLALFIFAIFLFFKKECRIKSIILFFSSFTPFVIWTLWLKKQTGGTSAYLPTFFKGSSHSSPMAFIFQRLGLNIKRSDIFSLLLNEHILPSSIKNILGALVIVILIVGLIDLLKKRREYLYIPLYCIIYLMVILLWPNRETERFLFPLIPLFFSLIIYGFFILMNKIKIKNKIFIAILIVGMFVIFKVPQGINMGYCLIKDHHFPPQKSLSSELLDFMEPINWSHCGETLHLIYNNKDYRPRAFVLYKLLTIVKYIKKYTPKEAIICARKPRMVSLLAERKALRFPCDENKFMQFVIKNKINYVIIDQYSYDTHRFVVPAINKNLQKFKPVFNLDGTLLIQYIGDFTA